MFTISANHGSDENRPFASLFTAPPIDPHAEIAAYESLWLSEGTWFKNLADLFEKNPGAVPSELVPRQTIADTWALFVETLGIERIRQIGVRVHGAGEYPAKLRDADHPVELLYYLGNWELVDTVGIAVVGARHPSALGIENARRIAKMLVKYEYTVVSGLAEGIDTAAHTAALEDGGRTVAVAGTPLFDVYPRENRDLQNRIAREQLLISQVPFLRHKRQHYKSNRFFFPARNVTMSALTVATVIVEASDTSGTLVQARAALAQGRKLFILDSCFRDSSLTWPSKFEKLGAIRVSRASEIIEALANDSATQN